MSQILKACIWLPLITLLFPCLLVGDTTGTILGLVTDPSSAVIQGARGRVTNIDTNQSWEATSDASAQDRILSLPVGQCRLQASFAGFQTFIETGIVLSIDQERRVDVVM